MHAEHIVARGRAESYRVHPATGLSAPMGKGRSPECGRYRLQRGTMRCGLAAFAGGGRIGNSREVEHVAAETTAAHPTSDEDIVVSLADFIRDLRIDRPELGAVKAALERGDIDAAGRAYTAWLRTKDMTSDLFVDWDTTAQASVAQLRTMNERYPADPHLLELVAELSATDAAFRHLWADHTVGPRRHTTKAFDHPDLGAVAYDFETLHLPDGELRISVYTSTGRQASYS